MAALTLPRAPPSSPPCSNKEAAQIRTAPHWAGRRADAGRTRGAVVATSHERSYVTTQVVPTHRTVDSTAEQANAEQRRGGRGDATAG